MSKVAPEFLPENPHLDQLYRSYEETSTRYEQAIKDRDQTLADQIQREQRHLLAEMRMINPGIELSEVEKVIKEIADDENSKLNTKEKKMD